MDTTTDAAADQIAQGLEELQQQGTIAPPEPPANGTEHAPPAAALGHAMTMVGQQFAAANKYERQAENPDEFVFDGPFDAQRAIDEIFRLDEQVDAARKDWDRAAKKAKELKDVFDKAVTKRSDRGRELKRWERGEDTQQPRLRTLTEDERNAETVDARRARLAEQLRTKQFYITADEMTGLDRTELDSLDNWLGMAEGVVPPQLLTKAHVADEQGQCTNCGARLALEDDKTYPKGAFVGLDCQAPARKPKTKKRKRSSSPEQEAAQQQQEGATRGDEELPDVEHPDGE